MPNLQCMQQLTGASIRLQPEAILREEGVLVAAAAVVTAVGRGTLRLALAHSLALRLARAHSLAWAALLRIHSSALQRSARRLLPMVPLACCSSTRPATERSRCTLHVERSASLYCIAATIAYTLSGVSVRTGSRRARLVCPAEHRTTKWSPKERSQKRSPQPVPAPCG